MLDVKLPDRIMQHAMMAKFEQSVFSVLFLPSLPQRADNIKYRFCGDVMAYQGDVVNHDEQKAHDATRAPTRTITMLMQFEGWKCDKPSIIPML